MDRHKSNVPKAHADAVWAAAWTADGASFVTGSADERVKCWSVTDFDAAPVEATVMSDGGASSTLGLNDVVCPSAAAIAMSPHLARIAASVSLDSVIRFWNLDTGACVHNINPGAAESWHLAWSHDGRRLASGSHAGVVNVWRVEAAADGGLASRKVASLATGTDNFVMAVAFSPDGRFLASGHHDGRVCVFVLDGSDSFPAAPTHTLELHSKPVRSLAWTHDGRLLSASDDGSTGVCDIGGGGAEQLASLRGHTSWVLCVDAHPDGRRCVTGGAEGAVKVWDTETRECVATFAKHTAQVWSVRFAPDGEHFLSVGDDGSIQMYACASN